MSPRRAFSVSAYVLNQGAVLLVRHKRLGAWLPIGGELEAGETPKEAIIREVHEEIGWELGPDYWLPPKDPMSPAGLLAYEEHDAGSKGLHMNFAFMLNGRHRNIRPCEEFTDIAWVAHVEQVDPVPSNVSTILSRVFRLTV